MSFKIIVPLVILWSIIGHSCTRSERGILKGHSDQPYPATILISDQGDTICTGIPIPARGKIVNLKEMIEPKSIPVKCVPQVTSAHPNVQAAGPFTTISIPKDLPRIIPGQKGIPMPKTVPAQGKKVASIEPPPIPASIFRMKESAIANIQYLDVDQGMMSSYVWCLIEDRQGNIWFGTNNGVSRYDGNTFRHYLVDQGLCSNRSRSLLEDKNGNIWFGTDGGGACCYDGVNFTHYNSENGLSDNHIWCMLEDSRGNIWFGTENAGVSRFDGKHFTHFSVKEGLSHNSVWAVAEDHDGNLWFGTNGGGLSRYDGTGFTHYTMEQGLSSNTIWSMLIDNQRHLWLGTESGGVNRMALPAADLDGQVTIMTKKDGLSDNTIWCMKQDDENNVWFGTESAGVCSFDGENFIQYSSEEGLNSNRIWSMMKDSQGNLWFGSRGGGINRYHTNSFNHFTQGLGQNQRVVWSICEDRNENLWFGFWEGGVSQYDGTHLTHYTINEGLSNNIITSILQDQKGDLWFATEGGGVNRFDGTYFTYYDTSVGLSHNNVQSMLEDRSGRIWFGTRDGGVTCYDGKDFIQFKTNEGLNNNIVRAILEDRKGNIWFGTQGGGVSRYDGCNFTHLTTNEGLANNLVWAMLEDSQGDIWFGTQGGGLSKYANEQFTNYTTEDGLSHNWIWSIAEDQKNRIWVSTERGITVLIPKENSSGIGSKTKSREFDFYSFGTADGLRRLDFSQNVCLNTKDQIWWPSNDGITKLDLDHFTLPKNPPVVKLNTIEIAQKFVDYRNLENPIYQNSLPFGKSLAKSVDSIMPFKNYPEKMDLPHGLNHLTFRFSAIEWSAPHKLQYTYFMEGLDEDWSQLSPVTTAEYRNLPPGDYTFQVKSIGAAAQWSEPLSYAFSIHPAWWFSWWAKSLYTLLGTFLIFTVVRFRTSHLEQRQKELQDAVEERSAEAVAERNRSDVLLLNILPAEVAQELKETGRTQPVRFEEVSILFADFKEFTNIVASIPGKKLVEELDDMFQHFDEIMDEVGLEKIQTVGDTYLAAAGLHRSVPNNATNCVLAGKKMISYLEDRNNNHAIKWKLRIGIHTGPITAGVVGKKKFSYDIFGDTVNIAARVESASEEGKINISAYTYALIKDDFDCQYRGKINAKGKGDLDMYFVV